MRITQEEDEMLQTQAAIKRISVAEYMRRKFFGGRPIIARTDDLTIRYCEGLADGSNTISFWRVRTIRKKHGMR